ncbi:MAG: small subunit ribosomal protein S6 [Ulvibacter sp.]|jgi:small subunit ribosomal protein S6
MVNRYETVFILTPVLSEEQTKDAVKNYKSLLKENKVKVVHEESWGRKKLAYPIQKKTTGFYHVFEYEAEGTVIDKLELAFRRDEKVMRFLTIKMEKEHIAFAESQRKKKKEAVSQGAEK